MRMHTPILTTLLALAWILLAQSACAQEEPGSKHFQTSDGVELHYLEAGAGPLLVFVPGWTMPAWIWQAQLDHFAATHHVVALDPRGQGASEKVTYGYTAVRQSQDVCELLDHLNDEPAVLVGWSIAGQRVLMCADEVGMEVVRAVVVVDWEITMEANRDFAADRIASLHGDRRAFTRAFVEAIHRDPEPTYVEALTKAVLAVPTNAAAMSTANWFFFGPHDTVNRTPETDPWLFEGIPNFEDLVTGREGDWLVVLGSAERAGDTAATIMRAADTGLAAIQQRVWNAGAVPFAVASEELPTFAPGLTVLVLGPYPKPAADDRLAELRAVVPDAYVKAGW